MAKTLPTLIKAGAPTGDGYGPAPCRRSNRGNIVSTSYTTSRDSVTLKSWCNLKYPQRQLGDGSRTAYRGRRRVHFKYPQRQLGDSFRYSLIPFTQKPFHQRRSHFAAGPRIS